MPHLWDRHVQNWQVFVVFRGYISLSGNLYNARRRLLALGFEVHGAGRVVARDTHNQPSKSEFPVSCTEEVLDSVDHLFGQLIWSLDRIDE